MPLGVTHALRRNAGDVRRLEGPAGTTQRTETNIVEHDVDDVRRPRRSYRRLERCPVRLRVANVDVDDAFERLGHDEVPSIEMRARAWHACGMCELCSVHDTSRICVSRASSA